MSVNDVAYILFYNAPFQLRMQSRMMTLVKKIQYTGMCARRFKTRTNIVSVQWNNHCWSMVIYSAECVGHGPKMLVYNYYICQYHSLPKLAGLRTIYIADAQVLGV